MITYYGIIGTSSGRFAIVRVDKPRAINGRPQPGTQTETGETFAEWNDAIARIVRLNTLAIENRTAAAIAEIEQQKNEVAR